MSTIKRCISLLLVLCLLLSVAPVTAHAAFSGTCGENLTWTISDDGVLTISGTGPMEDFMLGNYDADTAPWYHHRYQITDVIIEDGITSIGNYAFYLLKEPSSVAIPDSITTIGDYAFQYCDSLNSVIFGNSVTTIGDYAFNDCGSLTNVIFPDGITTIGNYAFNDCDSLTSVTVPTSVTTIGAYAFGSCLSLCGIHVDENNSSYSSDPYGVLFDKQKTNLIQAPGAISGSYTIPDGVTTIGNAAFGGCKNLSSVAMPNSVETIGTNAFSGAEGLTSVTFPDTLVRIGSYAFENCKSLINIRIPNGVTEITSGAFYGCNNLREIFLPNGVTSIGVNVFDYCTSLASITIPASVSSIGKATLSNSFAYCNNLEAINVDPENQFYCSVDGVLMSKDQTKLFTCPPGKTGSYTVPDTVTSIKYGAFETCAKLTDVTIGDSVTSISNAIFHYCSSLRTVKIGRGIEKLPISSFGLCESLEKIIFCGDAPYIDSGAFEIPQGGGIVATAYYPADNPTWTSDKLKDYGGTITWVPYTDPNSTPNNGTYTSPQESVWYDIWCAGVSRFNAEKNFDLNVGDQTYPTGDSRKARADIPVELAEQVSISKDSWLTCSIPRELVYTCREVVLYPDTQKAPFAQFVAARNNGESMYVNLSCSHLSVYENAMRTYDMYVDINWNGYTPGKIYLKQGDRTLELREGKNQGLMLGTFSASGGDLLLCWETADGKVYSQKMYLDIYKNSISNIKLNGGESAFGANKTSEKEDEMWGGLSFSIDLFNDTIPVELEMKATGLNKGTFKGTIGIEIPNYENKRTVIDLLDTVLDTHVDFTTFGSVEDALKLKFPDTLIPQNTNAYLISVDTQFIGLVEGTYKLGSDGSLVDMQFTDSKILTKVDGDFSVTRQHIVTPAPWYWTLKIKAGAELALELQNKYDGTMASIAPLTSAVEFGLGAKPAVGVSGAVGVGVNGVGNLHIGGQVLPFDASKAEIYANYNISLYGELGPFAGDIFPYKSDNYYLMKDGKWVFSDNPSTGGGGGFRDNIPSTELEMQQIPRDYFENSHRMQLNSITDTVAENLVKANTYTFTEPQIVQLDNGNLLLVWVDDPGVAVRPVDINRAALFYSVYDGTSWSTPAMVSDDGTADASPVLKSIDGNVYLLWNNANTVLDEAAGYAEYCAALDIAYARFDSADGVFTDVSVIDTNEYCDILPDMTLVNGFPTVVWLQNTANDPFQISGRNKLYSATLKSGNWNTAVLADSLAIVDGLAAKDNGDALNVYISQDTDSDTTTVEDRELFQVSENGISQITDNDVADLKPVVINESLYRYQNGVLTDGTQTVQLAEDTDRYVAAGNGTDSAVLYQKFNEDDSVTICANILHNGAWSDEIELVTIDRYLQKFDVVMADDGSITIITNEVELSDSVYQKADLCSYVFGQECDISVQQVCLNPLSMAPGGNMELFATIKNKGTAESGDVYARIYDGEILLKEELLSIVLDAGIEATTILTYPLEEGFDSEYLRVEFIPVSGTDRNEGNNTAVCEISYADVSVEELTAIQSNGTAHVSAYISNRGLTELSDVEVILYSTTADEKNVIDRCTIPSLEIATGETVTFDVALEIDTVVHVEAVISDEEFNLSNNSDFSLIAETSDVLSTPVENNPFTDVTPSDYYYTPVLWAVEEGITKGITDTRFAPDDLTTRGQIVTFLWRAAGEPEPASNANPFTDVKGEDFCYKAVLWAVDNGITKGMTETIFAPNSSCTRAQAVTFLHRYMGKPAYTITGSGFTDVTDPKEFCYDAILWAVENGITGGLGDGTFGVDQTCTRGQIVTFLYRTLA